MGGCNAFNCCFIGDVFSLNRGTVVNIFDF